MRETVHLNRDNPNTIILEQDGELIDFTAVTRMVLSFVDSDVVADTDQDSGLISWNANGEVTFNINDLGMDNGDCFFGTLIAYDPDHLDGQVLFNGEEFKHTRRRSRNRYVRFLFVNA